MIETRLIEQRIDARVTEEQICGSLLERPISCRITERVSDDLFFSLYNEAGDEVKITVFDSQGNELYLTGKR
jgi:hypothetical protein